MIVRKTAAELEKMRRSGLLVWQILQKMKELAVEGAAGDGNSATVVAISGANTFSGSVTVVGISGGAGGLGGTAVTPVGVMTIAGAIV